MHKKGLSVIVSSVMLILLAVLLATAIYLNARTTVLSLSPEVDCYGIDFRAEIIREANADYLEVVNDGNLAIEGFYIKVFGEGEVYTFEEIIEGLEPGRSRRVALVENYADGTYLVVPKVIGKDGQGNEKVAMCKDLYGYEIVLGP